MRHATLRLIYDELRRARTKFPRNEHQYVALAEEVGELAQALLHYTLGKASEKEVIGEAVQCAAMAIRVIEDGDDSFNFAPLAESYLTHFDDAKPYEPKP